MTGSMLVRKWHSAANCKGLSWGSLPCLLGGKGGLYPPKWSSIYVDLFLLKWHLIKKKSFIAGLLWSHGSYSWKGLVRRNWKSAQFLCVWLETFGQKMFEFWIHSLVALVFFSAALVQFFICGWFLEEIAREIVDLLKWIVLNFKCRNKFRVFLWEKFRQEPKLKVYLSHQILSKRKYLHCCTNRLWIFLAEIWRTFRLAISW